MSSIGNYWGNEMKQLIAFSTAWGSKHGGINSFNYDFIMAFSAAYNMQVEVICFVSKAEDEQIEDASNAHVKLISLETESNELKDSHAEIAISILKSKNILLNTNELIWLGHDKFTGEAAISAAERTNSKSALIHHMSYAHYESISESSVVALEKAEMQARIFLKATYCLAIGPTLRDALWDRLGGTREIGMLIPGMAEIDPVEAPKTFTAFLSGRLKSDTAKIKQGLLGVAAFAEALKDAGVDGMPKALILEPKLILYGLPPEENRSDNKKILTSEIELDLKKFSEKYSNSLINLQALPFTENRSQLFDQLRKSSMAMMPSWHEGFGMVGWEAIAAGVPLIVSKKSGLFRLIEEVEPGAENGYLFPVEIKGANDEPYFSDDDIKEVKKLIKVIANNPELARRKAKSLRALLSKYNWASCAGNAAKYFEWDLQKGSIGDGLLAVEDSIETLVNMAVNPQPLLMPIKRWQPNQGMADSQLLRAEEELVPFHSARAPELAQLLAWMSDLQYPQAIRLITGQGGVGKTRLGLELCQLSVKGGWAAGFLDPSLGKKDMVESWEKILVEKKPALIIIDYAETRQAILLELIKAVLSKKSTFSVRILLIARDGGEWWNSLPSIDSQCEALLSGYATTGPFPLPPLHSSYESKLAAYKQSMAIYSSILGVAASNIIPDLESDYFEHPLYLQMAALIALHGERPTTADGLIKALLNHERRYWLGLLSNIFGENSGAYAQSLLALTTLAGGFVTARDANQRWQQYYQDNLNGQSFNILFNLLIPLYPGKQGLESVKPDLLGEGLVSDAIIRPGGNMLLSSVLSSSASSEIKLNSLTVLSRITNKSSLLKEAIVEAIAQNFLNCYSEIIVVSKETVGKIPEYANLAFHTLSPQKKSQLAGLIKPYISDNSVSLSELYLSVAEYFVQKSESKIEKNPNGNEEKYQCAKDMYEYVNWLQRRNRSEDALAVSRKSLAYYESIDSKDVRYKAGYSIALLQYSDAIRDYGSPEEALIASKKALDNYERYVINSIKSNDSNYGVFILNYCEKLGDIGHTEEALKYSKKGLDIIENASLSDQNSVYNYMLALDNYATNLNAEGRYDDALYYYEKSLKVSEDLAKNNLDVVEPVFAGKLHSYALILFRNYRFSEAKIFLDKSLKVRERLALKNPERYEATYSRSLMISSKYLIEDGHCDLGMANAHVAYKISERLFANNNKLYAEIHANNLQYYSSKYNFIGNVSESLNYAILSNDVFKELVSYYPNSQDFKRDLSHSYVKLSGALYDVGRDDEAVDFFNVALNIVTELKSSNSIKYNESYAEVCEEFADYYLRSLDFDGSYKYYHISYEIIHDLYVSNSIKYESSYINALQNYAWILAKFNKLHESLELIRQALQLCNLSVKKYPLSSQPELFYTLRVIHNIHYDNGDEDESILYLYELLDVVNSIAKQNRSLFDADRAEMSYQLVIVLWAYSHDCDSEFNSINNNDFHLQSKSKQRVVFLTSFVGGLISSSVDERKILFNDALKEYGKLLRTDKMEFIEIYFVLCGYLEKYDYVDFSEFDWKVKYKKYLIARNNFSSHFLKVAQLKFGFTLN